MIGLSVDPTVLVGAAAAVIGAVGGVFTAWVAMRGKQRDDRQMLIDQLQEERNAEREERRKEREEFATQLASERAEIAAERVEHSERLDKMWADKSASRAYIGSLEQHIWQHREPPPPTPPVGYIP
ncbi:MAG TPA: hypothetical protein VN133_05265 [Humibacter sp.]|nr:hypothetical protein [Humibacter sp.]